MKLKTISYLIITLFLSCQNGVVQNFTIIQDLRSNFDIHTVEFSQDIKGKNLRFILKDLDFYEFDENGIKKKAIEINKYLSSKYSEIKHAKNIRYDFYSPADVGYVIFNEKSEITEISFLKKKD